MSQSIFICYTAKHLINAIGFSETIGGECLVVIVYENQWLDPETLFRVREYIHWCDFVLVKIKGKKIYRKILAILCQHGLIRKKVVNIKIGCLIDEKEKERRWYLFHDSPLLSKIVLAYSGCASLVEEGESNYFDFCNELPLRQRLRYVLFAMPYPLGRDRRIREVYLKNPGRAPMDIQAKVRGLSLTQSNEAGCRIAKAFLPDKTLHNIVGKKSKSLLILTQNLALVGLDQADIRSIYGSIIFERAGLDTSIYIKPHPADETDYSCLVGVTIIPKQIPIEALNYLDVEIDEGVSIIKSSTQDLNIVKRWTILLSNVQLVEQVHPDKLKELAQ